MKHIPILQRPSCASGKTGVHIRPVFLTATPASQSASEVPSLSRRVVIDWAACQVGAHGPQFAPFGIHFKLRRYADKYANTTNLPAVLKARTALVETRTQAIEQARAAARSSQTSRGGLINSMLFWCRSTSGYGQSDTHRATCAQSAASWVGKSCVSHWASSYSQGH